MTDARLVATNPETSELVPVAVNAQGQLKTEPGRIELIDNDLTITGDLIVGGTINGEESGGGGGSGLPEPLGDEGQIIQVVDGEPIWVSNPSVPAMGSYAVTIIQPPEGNTDALGIYDANGNEPNLLVSWDTYQRMSNSWMGISAENKQGIVSKGYNTMSFKLNIQAETGKILQLRISGYSYCTEGKNNDWTINTTSDHEHVVPVTPSTTWNTGNCPVWQYHAYTATFLINRPNIGEVTFNVTMSGSKIGRGYGETLALTGWEDIDAGQYLIQRMLEMRKDVSTADLVGQLLPEVVPATDIDCLRSS